MNRAIVAGGTREPAASWRTTSAAAGLCLLAAALIFQGALTSTMALHMLAHIPMVFVSGMLLASALGVTARRRREHGRAVTTCKPISSWSYNEYGLAGFLLATLVLGYWMIPKALDDVLVSESMSALKYVSVLIAGMAVRDSLQRSNRVILIFFLGDFCWMAAIVGMLYQENPARLCNFYLLSDQEFAGRGLVLLSIILPLGWLLCEIKPLQRYSGND